MSMNPYSLRPENYDNKLPHPPGGSAYSQGAWDVWRAENGRLAEKLKADLFDVHGVSGPIAELTYQKASETYNAEAFGNAGLIGQFDELVEIVKLCVTHGAVL